MAKSSDKKIEPNSKSRNKLEFEDASRGYRTQIQNNMKLVLNKEQLKAVKHKDGPLLVIAGAGTGKTTVITERIKFIIEKEWAKPSEILALTFTEKAAREMEERVDVALPYGYTDTWISTFHSFCDRILRDSALNIGYDPKFKLMTTSVNIQFLKKNLFDFELDYFRPLGNPTKFLEGMLQHFSRLQDEDITPNEYLKWVEKLKKKKTKNEDEKTEIDKWLESAGAYKKYEELKVKEGVMDYGDLIVKTLMLFRKRINVLKDYQKKFKYILVDEFQDTNISQNELVKLLVDKSQNITMVADDDQAIYRWRGAAVSNVVQFRKSFPKTKVIILTKNYRSSQEILDRAYDLIQFNNPDRLEVVEKINKKLKSKVKYRGSEIKFIHKNRVENEADEVVRKIKEINENPPSRKASDGQGKSEWKDFAILVRANNHAEPFVRALQRHSVPYQFLGPGRLFKQSEIIDLISYLKILYDFEDSVSFSRLLSIEAFEIDVRDIIRLSNYAKRNNLNLFEATEKVLKNSGSDIYLKDETKAKLKNLVEILNSQIKLVKKESTGQLLYNFLEKTKLLTKLLNPDTKEAEKKALNISKFFDKLKTYETDHDDSSISSVVDWIELSSELGESPLAANEDWTQVNAVNILTIHSAKGLEFKNVFLVNLVSQRFPSVERREQVPIPDELVKEILPSGDHHLQEERRLFYVGMTRAKEKLFLTASDYYGEGKREKKLSPFIFESLGEKTTTSEISMTSGEQLSFLDYEQKELERKEKQPTTKFHIDYLSYSQIETFNTCPLHFKLRYILKIPTPQTAAQSFGTAMHAALKNFYEDVISGKKPSNRLIYKKLEENWINSGFKSKQHEKKFFEKGKVYLSGFLKNGFNENNLPLAMEQKFIMPLPYKKGEKQLKIGGIFDRVDKLGKNSIEIVDYKTGATIPTQSAVDKNKQLTTYALAATTLPEKPFAKKPEEVNMTLYYLDQQEKITTTRTKEELNEAVEEIYKVRSEIEKSDFKCSHHMFCQQNCEYSLFCRED